MQSLRRARILAFFLDLALAAGLADAAAFAASAIVWMWKREWASALPWIWRASASIRRNLPLLVPVWNLIEAWPVLRRGEAQRAADRKRGLQVVSTT
jgi:hypothetical protein